MYFKCDFFSQNSPKYISCLNPDLELQFHYKVHTSLDVVEEKLSSVGKSSGDVRELYLGLLYSSEEHKMYPLITTCKGLKTAREGYLVIKIVLQRNQMRQFNHNNFSLSKFFNKFKRPGSEGMYY